MREVTDDRQKRCFCKLLLDTICKVYLILSTLYFYYIYKFIEKPDIIRHLSLHGEAFLEVRNPVARSRNHDEASHLSPF